MSIFTRRALIGPVAALLLLAACQSNASPSASTAASEAASAQESVGASVAPTPVATIPTDQLSFPGTLVVWHHMAPPCRRSSSTAMETQPAPTSTSRLRSRSGLD